MNGELTPALRRLARLYGVQLTHTDGRCERYHATRESLVAVLRALGASVQGEGDAAAAVIERERELRDRLAEPVLVAWDGALPPIRLRVPLRSAGGPARLELREEGGETRAWAAPATPRSGAARQPSPFGRVACEAPGRAGIPLGRHTLSVETGDERAEVHVIAAPRTAFAPEAPASRWGLFAPVYAMRSERDWGVGDYGMLADVGAWSGRRGASFIGTLPLHPCFLEAPLAYSPYAPVSRLCWSELYIDLLSAPELETCAEARTLIASSAFRAHAAALRQADLVDYRAAMTLRRSVLAALAEHVFASGSPRLERLRAFAAGNPEVERYARFRATMDRAGAVWRAWPAGMEGPDLPSGACREADHRRHLYGQFLAHEQLDRTRTRLAAEGVDLYLDMTLGVHPDGYDAWRFRAIFAEGVNAGAPPDDFFTGGQDWGFPPLRPDRARADGHAYFSLALRAQMRFAHMLRVDHVMGLHRLYWAPHGLGPKQGLYVRYPAEEQYAALCLESRRAGARVIGENLGTVPARVNRAMRRRSVASMYVAQFKVDPDADPPLAPPAPDALASLNTHDTPTFAAFWRGRDIDDRVDLGLLDAHDARAEHQGRERIREALVGMLAREGLLEGSARSERAILAALLGALASSRAEMLAVTLEDLWLEERPQNTPGTWEERINWRRKMSVEVDTMMSRPDVLDTLARVAGRRNASG